MQVDEVDVVADDQSSGTCEHLVHREVGVVQSVAEQRIGLDGKEAIRE